MTYLVLERPFAVSLPLAPITLVHGPRRIRQLAIPLTTMGARLYDSKRSINSILPEDGNRLCMIRDDSPT